MTDISTTQPRRSGRFRNDEIVAALTAMAERSEDLCAPLAKALLGKAPLAKVTLTTFIKTELAAQNSINPQDFRSALAAEITRIRILNKDVDEGGGIKTLRGSAKVKYGGFSVPAWYDLLLEALSNTATDDPCQSTRTLTAAIHSVLSSNTCLSYAQAGDWSSVAGRLRSRLAMDRNVSGARPLEHLQRVLFRNDDTVGLLETPLSDLLGIQIAPRKEPAAVPPRE